MAPLGATGRGAGERRWELTPGRHRVETVVIGGFLLVVLPIDAALAWFTASAVATPFGADLAAGYPEGWLAAR